MASMFDLNGRLALVTGSSKGIGLAFAAALAEAGAEIVINARNAEELEATRGRLADAGHKVHALPFDVTDQAAVQTNVKRIENEIGPIDILFNNAGMQYRTPLEEFPGGCLAADHGHQSRQRFLRRPSGRSAHDPARPRQDRQHLLGRQRDRPWHDRPLHDVEGRR